MSQTDYYAFIVSQAQANVTQLARYEAQAEEARQTQDGAGRKRAEDDSRRVRGSLLVQQDASTLFLYGVASSVFNSDAFRSEWQSQTRKVDARSDLKKWQLDRLFADHWDEFDIDLIVLPPYSFRLGFTFTLAQPYLSKDDNPFYIIDNPIVRDKVFRLPMVRPSSWKGSLKAALRQTDYAGNEQVMERLFGDINEANGEGQAGRLFFYPTFFTHTSLEIINPHDRTRRVGKNPILFESVPIQATGRFTVLYVPFDEVGNEQDKSKVAADLEVLTDGLRAMFTLYGFGAKTSSGFGLASERVSEGKLTLRSTEAQAAPSAQAANSVAAAAPAASLPRYLETLDHLASDYRNPDGSFRQRSEAELKAMKKADRQLYDKAKSWWEREGKELAAQQPAPSQPQSPATQAPTWPSWSFDTFAELADVAKQVAGRLHGGDQP